MALFRRPVKDISSRLARVERAIDQGDLATAMELLESLLDRCPADARDQVERTMAATRLRLVDDLLESVRSAPNPRLAKSLIDSAAEWAEGDPDLERRVRDAAPPAEPATTAADARPDSAPSRAAPAEEVEILSETETDDDPEAAAYELLIANAGPDEAREYEDVGDAFVTAYGALQRGAYPEAAAMLADLVERRPNASFLRFHLASAQAASARWTEAAVGFASCLEVQADAEFSPTIWAAYLGLSECLESAGNREDAVASLERCVERYPEEPSPRLALTALYRRCGRAEDALAHADRLIHDPEVRAVAELRVASAREHALCLSALGQHGEARGAIQRYIEQASGRHRDGFWDEEAMVALAAACEDEGDREAADQIYTLLAQHASSDEARRSWNSRISGPSAG